MRHQILEAGVYTVEARRIGYYTERREIAFGSHALCAGACSVATLARRSLDFAMRLAELPES